MNNALFTSKTGIRFHIRRLCDTRECQVYKLLFSRARRPKHAVEWARLVQSAVWQTGWPVGQKAYMSAQTGALVVMLLPARTDTAWFHDYIYRRAEIRFVRGRLKFGGSRNSAPFPSMVCVFRG